MHNWSVWHGMLPFSGYEIEPAVHDRIRIPVVSRNANCGSVHPPEDRTGIYTPVMLAHQKNSSGNSIIHDYMLRDYSEPKDFTSFLYASQVLQAEGIKIGTEHLRRIDRARWGRSTGS